MTRRALTYRNSSLIAGCLLGGFLLAACASTGSQSRSEAIAETLADARVGEKVDRICFTRGIDSFSEEKRNSVVLRRGVNDEYLVIMRSCPQLDMAQSMRLDSTGGCLRRADHIRVYQSAFGPSDADRFAFDRCLIDDIYKWDDDAVEAADDTPDSGDVDTDM